MFFITKPVSTDLFIFIEKKTKENLLLKDIINSYNCLLKNDNFLFKTTND